MATVGRRRKRAQNRPQELRRELRMAGLSILTAVAGSVLAQVVLNVLDIST